MQEPPVLGEACRRLVVLARSSGGPVTLDDVERETGSVPPDVFHDILLNLQEDGVRVEHADEDDRLHPASKPTGVDSRQIYYRDAGSAALLTREGEIKLAAARSRVETKLRKTLSRVLPVADLFVHLLRDAIAGNRRPDTVVQDPPRPLAASSRRRPRRPLGDRIAAIDAAAGALADVLAGPGGDRSPQAGRLRIRLSAAVFSAHPAVDFWESAARRVDDVIGALHVAEDRAVLDGREPPRLGRLFSDNRLAGRAEFPVDDLARLDVVKDRARGLSNRLIEIRNLFMKANLRLVSGLARRRFRRSPSVEIADLEQVGNLGLMRAVDRFDPGRGCKFSTYATWWIRQAIARHEVEGSGDIRVPVHLVDLAYKVRAGEPELEKKLGRRPNDAELAEYLDVTVSEIYRVRFAPSATVSLEEPVGFDSGGGLEVLGSRIPDPNAADPESGYGEIQRRTACRRAMMLVLDPEEEQVIRERFGFPARADLGPPTVPANRRKALVASGIKKLRSPEGRGALKVLQEESEKSGRGPGPAARALPLAGPAQRPGTGSRA